MRAFLENPLFVLWLTLIIDLANPGTFYEYYNYHFHNASKEGFWPNFCFEFLARVKKCHFGNFEKMAALLNPCMKFKKCFGQKPSFEAGSAKSMIKVSRSTKRGFSKKPL